MSKYNTVMNEFMQYYDEDGNYYELVPQVYVKGGHACVGCDLKFANSNACKKAKTCTPKSDHKTGSQSLLNKPHVWKMKSVNKTKIICI